MGHLSTSKDVLIYKFVFGFLLIMSSVKCKKLIEVDPPIDQVVNSDIYNSNGTAASVLTGIYTEMSRTNFGNFSLKTGLSSDEFVNTAPPGTIYYTLYQNSLSTDGDQLFWTDLYTYIFKVNSAIEGIDASTGLSLSVKNQLLGEAKFIRAFMYFYLLNLYGDVPLLTSTDIKFNGTASRASLTEVYKQIMSDLIEAQDLLSDHYLDANVTTESPERLRPNKSAATALLARVYLYNKEWGAAEAEASKIIDNSSLFALSTLETAFLKNSKEAIWQLQPVAQGLNTIDAQNFVLLPGNTTSEPGPNGSSRPVYLNPALYNDFEANDDRKKIWVDTVSVGRTLYPFAYKYKSFDFDQPRVEYTVVIRLSELYLIRAEARVYLGKLTGAGSAQTDLNTIRNRANLSDTQAQTQPDLLDAILRERRFELFSEWGHRWLDLKRVGKINEVMAKVIVDKGGTWAEYKSLYPLPVYDIQHNPSLRGHQNPGYPER